MSKRDDGILLAEMADHANQAMEFCHGLTLETFSHNSMVKMATTRCIQIIGEAANRVSAGFRDTHPEIPWRQVIGTRNILVHQYFELDDEALWKIVIEDLPSLVGSLTKLINGIR